MNSCEENKILFDNNINGYLVSCYFPFLKDSNGSDKNFLWSVLENTGGIFIPGIRNHFNPNVGLSFRINLCRDDIQFRSTLLRVFNYLSNSHNKLPF
jgi:hypothetical protein